MGLKDQLEALGLHKGTAHLPPRHERAGSGHDIEDLIAGEIAQTSLGACFIRDQRLSPVYLHGAALLSSLWEQHPTTLARLAQNAAFADLDPTRIVFLDIETTGLAGGTGTYAFLIGIGYFEPDRSFVVRQFFMRDYGEEPAQLALLCECLERFAAVVSFNGRVFDLPLVETRLALARMPSPLAGAPHLDLLFPARRLWQGWLPSCALSALEVYVLDVRRGSEDVPGYIIPSLYFDYLRTGDAGPLINVFWHNQQDILSMVVLAVRLAQALDMPHSGRLAGHEMLGVARIYEEMGLTDESEGIYQAALRKEMPAAGTRIASRRLAALYKRAGRRAEAATLWTAMLDDASPDTPLAAYVDLAKHYEWIDGDFSLASEVTQRAIAWVRRWQRGLERQHSLQELEHRLQRLQRKQNGTQKPDAGATEE